MRALTVLLLLITLITVPIVVVIAGENDGYSPGEITLEQLSWLSGYWVSEDTEDQGEELWLQPGGGVMLGLHRDVSDEGNMMFEYLRIMQTADGLVYYASPRGYETTKFQIVSYTDEDGVKEVVFENPEHDFPRLIRYALDKYGLMAQAEGLDDGQQVVATWRWSKSEFPR